MKYLIAAAIFALSLTYSGATAQQVTPHDSTYYDFWEGNWYQVVDGEVEGEPRFQVERGIYHSSFEEKWQMEGYKAKAWRGWDSSTNSWTFVWVSELGHFQVWDEKKVGERWYMFKTFNIDGEEILSRQAFIPQNDSTLIRTSEHSRDGGDTWTLRFKETYRKRN